MTLSTPITFSQAGAELFIPDGASLPEAIQRTTHLGIGAHQDDLEFMALHGIGTCYHSTDKWFGGITCTDGAGSSRSGPFATYSDEQMKAVRVEEQRAAAALGQYAYMAQLAHPSSHAKAPESRRLLVEDLQALITRSGAGIVYTHHLFDKHPTHVGVCLAVIEAIRRLPPDERPAKVYGCEVWRSLDWLPDDLKVVHDVSGHEALSGALSAIFQSQILGGKRYDQAVEGRRLANATFLDPHAVDTAARVDYAIDLTSLADPNGPEPIAFAQAVLNRFTGHIEAGISQLVNRPMGNVP
jgi:LmbE family N-acetylglucosaminyl deacetylase